MCIGLLWLHSMSSLMVLVAWFPCAPFYLTLPRCLALEISPLPSPPSIGTCIVNKCTAAFLPPFIAAGFSVCFSLQHCSLLLYSQFQNKKIFSTLVFLSFSSCDQSIYVPSTPAVFYFLQLFVKCLEYCQIKEQDDFLVWPSWSRLDTLSQWAGDWK